MPITLPHLPLLQGTRHKKSEAHAPHQAPRSAFYRTNPSKPPNDYDAGAIVTPILWMEESRPKTVSKLPAVTQLEKRQADLDANPSQSLWSAVCDLSSLGLGLPICEVELSLLKRS